ncbi:MAG: hydroxyacylglutathione hydrolase [Gammaproteobacteria bacterium]|nr:MAG: hydroxyacylglutathione hydrolase [Gammaproteobacteria bacterium]
MIQITPLNAFTDNYIWALVHENHKQLIVVDPGQAEPVESFINAHNLELTAIWITHKHADHTGGVNKLRETYPLVNIIADERHGVKADYIVKEGSRFSTWGYNIDVLKVVGHTQDHLAFVLNIDEKKHIFCGDTLFSGGCGRVFTGDMQAMYKSLLTLNSFEADTLFYPAHEYTANNLKFGLFIEPDNTAMQQWLKKVEKLTLDNQPSLPTTLEVERLINVFLRVNEPTVIESVSKKCDLSDKKPLTVFTALRKLKDNF